MARLRRSKLAAGFLLLFQCLSERCQLAGGETPRQSRGKRGRYLPGGAGPAPPRGAGAGVWVWGRVWGWGRAAPQPPRCGLCRPLRGPRTRSGLAPPPPERGLGSRLLIFPYHGFSGKSSL